MGVKPVEYVKDSSTQGFAVAGDEKPITQTNANTIQKDVNQGNTKDLDNAQDTYLSSLVDEDTIDYTADEQKNVGRNQIDTKGEDGKDLSEKDGKAGGIGASLGASVGAAGAAVAVGIAATIAQTATVCETQAKLYGSKFPGAMLAVGIISTIGAALAYALSFEGTFDPNLGERKNQTGAAEDNYNTLQAYEDKLSKDIEDMANESNEYKDLIARKTRSDLNADIELGALQAETAVYALQGNPNIDSVTTKISNIEKDKKEDPINDELNQKKEALETYAGNYNEAIGVAESGATVSDFLRDGNVMKKYAKAAQIASYVGAASMLIVAALASIRIAKDIAHIFTCWAMPMDAAGLAMIVVAGVMMSMAAGNFGKRAGDEGAAGDAGNQMAEYVANLNENIEAQGGFTEETSAGYDAEDAEYKKVMQKSKAGTNVSLKRQQEQLKPKKLDNKPISTPTPGTETEEPAA